MMKNWKRCLSIAMTLVMLVGVLPTAAFAEGETIQLDVPENVTYTGSDIEIDVTVTGLTGYKVSCDNGGSVSEDQKTVTVVNAGTYTVTVENTTLSAQFTIDPKTMDASAVSLTEGPYIYTGNDITPVVVKDGDKPLTVDKDYTVVYSNNVNAGAENAASAIVTFIGNYSSDSAVTKNFTIVQKQLTNPAIAAIADQHFTGSAIEPTVTVTENGTEIPKEHYSVSYSNNTGIGEAGVSVTFSENYSCTTNPITGKFNIIPALTDNLKLEVAASTAYTGTAPAVTVKNGETTLTTGFTLSYKTQAGAALEKAPVVPGNYTVTATFDDTYAMDGENYYTISQNYAITKAEITSASVSTAYGFCHASDTPEVTVTVGGRVLTSSDYDVTKSDSETTRTVTVTGKGNYTGTGTTTQTILPDTAPTIEGVASNGTYHTKPTVTVAGANLVKVFVKQGTGSTETEYTATTTDGETKASFVLDFSESAYTIRAVDKAGKSYTLATNVTVSRKPITFSMVTVTGVDDVTYDGTAKVATKIEVKDGDKTLLEGADKDYTVSYTNNTIAGTATITITGTGNYTGTVSKTFTIKPKALTSTALSGIVDKTYTGSPIEQENLTVKDDTTTLVMGSDKDYTVTYSNNTNPGTAKVTVTLRGNYSGVLEKTFTIGKDLSAMVNKIKALAAKTTLTYTEQQQIKQLKAAYDALSATDKAYVDREVGSALMTSFKNKASAAKFKLLNLPGLGYYRYTKGTSSNVVIKIDADSTRTLVTEIRMGKNLTVIDPDNYEVSPGSVVVTLSSSYLKQIKDTGKYNLYIDLLDTTTGHTETVQTVVRVLPATDIPGTGDPFQMTLWVGLLAVAVAGLVGFGAYEVVKKKKNAQKRLEAAMNLDEEPSDEAKANE